MSAVLKPAMRRAWPRQKLPGAIYHDFVRDEHAVDGVRKALDEIWTFERDSVINGWERENRTNLLNEFAIDAPAFVVDPATGQALGYRALAGFTNSLLWSRDLSNGVWSVTATVAQDAVGLDGVANTAWTVTDDSNTGTLHARQTVTVPDDSNPLTIRLFCKKDSDETRFPRLIIILFGGTTVRHDIAWNTATGENLDLPSQDGVSEIHDVGAWWSVEVTLQNNGTGNTSLQLTVNPAYNNSLTTGTDDSATGSIVYDFGGVYLNSSIAGPPIETEGAPVSTAADDATEPFPPSCQGGVVWLVHARPMPQPQSSPNFGLAYIGSIYESANDGADNRVDIFRISDSIQARVVSSGVSTGGTVVYQLQSATSVEDVKIAFSVEDGSQRISVNGNTVTNFSLDMPSGLAVKGIAQNRIGNESYKNAIIALDYLDPDTSAWTDADLQAATS